MRLPQDEDLWIFAYGSLMWRPGFAHVEAQPALLRGWHRAMCILSTIYRGTPERPGLVLGLDRGGACRGLALRVAAAEVNGALRYLHEREMVTNVYEPRLLPVSLADGRRIAAYGFVARRLHEQYRGRLPAAEAASLIRQGTGPHGTSRDYLAATVAHLDALACPDRALRRLLKLVDAVPVVTPAADR